MLSLETRKYTAVAACDLPANTLELTPRVPKAAKVHATSSHPHRAIIKVQQKTAPAGGLRQTKKEPMKAAVAEGKTATFFVTPEFKGPNGPKDVPAAKAAASASGGSDDAAIEAGGSGVAAVAASKSVDAAVAVHLWEWGGDESLHPFWAVSRLSAKELEKKNAEGLARQVFNMELVDKEFSVVTVGAVNAESVTMTTMVTVPIMVNSKRREGRR